MAVELFSLLFARSLGFFFFSPFFRWQYLPSFFRLGLSVAITLLLAPTFFAEHHDVPSFFVLNLLKESLIGYLLGFLFSLIFESVALAGEVIGSMMGLSVTELFQPLLNASSPLLAKTFALSLGALMFSLDLHHVLLRVFYDTIHFLPADIFNLNTIQAAIEGTASLFYHMFQYAWIPFFALSVVLIFLSVLSYLFQWMPVFWMGFPLQLLVGFIAIFAAFSGFPEILVKQLLEIRLLIEKILLNVV